MIYKTNRKLDKIILALGAESAGNFGVFNSGGIYHSDNFGDLFDDENFENYKNAIFNYLVDNKLQPDMIVADLHPMYRTTQLGKDLSEKYKSEFRQVQHHLAHIFSAVGEDVCVEDAGTIAEQARDCCTPIRSFTMSDVFYGIAMDGTGYGEDGKIWGGEVFKFQIEDSRLKIDRIGHLENQVLIGGDLAVREPARVLISILSRFLEKNEVYKYIEKYYNENQFGLLYNQMKQGFNCVESSSTGRVLDAVSVLLGFSKNKRHKKHGPTFLLEENSSEPYEIKPAIEKEDGKYILKTTTLFEYLLKNLDKDFGRLGASAQLYTAKGLFQAINTKFYFSGGMTNNKIISSYFKSKGGITNKKIPRGDAGLSFGQIIYSLLLIS